MSFLEKTERITVSIPFLTKKGLALLATKMFLPKSPVCWSFVTSMLRFNQIARRLLKGYFLTSFSH